MILFLTEKQIINNWDAIKADPYNNRPDIKTASEYISEAKAGNVTAGGVKVVIQNKLPAPQKTHSLKTNNSKDNAQ